MLFVSTCKLYLTGAGKIRAIGHLSVPLSFHYLVKYWPGSATIHRFNPPARVRVRYVIKGYERTRLFLTIGCHNPRHARKFQQLLDRFPHLTRVVIKPKIP